MKARAFRPNEQLSFKFNLNYSRLTYLIDQIKDFGENVCAFSGVDWGLVENSSLLQHRRFVDILKWIATTWMREEMENFNLNSTFTKEQHRILV